MLRMVEIGGSENGLLNAKGSFCEWLTKTVESPY